MNGNFFCVPFKSGGVLLSAIGEVSDLSGFRGLGGPILRIGFGSCDRLGGSSTKVAFVDCLRRVCAFVLVAELISGEAPILTRPFEIEGSSRHGFSSSIDSSDGTFHGDKARASSARPPGKKEHSEVANEDDFPVDDTFPPDKMPSEVSLGADSCMLPDVRLSEAISGSILRVLGGKIPHFLREESSDLLGSFLDIGSSSSGL